MKTDWLQTNFLTEKQKLFKCVFSLNSMKTQLSLDTLLNADNNFLTENFLKIIRKIQLFQILLYSINFKMVSLESSLHCASDEKTAFHSVCMLRWNCLLKITSQKILPSRSHMHWKKKLTSHFIKFLKITFDFHKNKLQ